MSQLNMKVFLRRITIPLLFYQIFKKYIRKNKKKTSVTSFTFLEHLGSQALTGHATNRNRHPV